MGNFWQSIKTGFQRGWQNGNIAKITSAVGQTAFTVGFTGMAIHEMNKPSCHHNNSIFGSGFGCGCNNGFGNWMQYDPMGFTGWMGQQDYGTNPFLTNMGLMSAYQSGQQMMMRMMAQSPQSNYSQYYQQFQQQYQQQAGNQTTKMDNKYAGKWDESQDTDPGSKLNEAMNDLVDENEKPIADKSVTISNSTNQSEYVENLSNLAKSYGASIDSEYGNDDQEVSKEEFIKHKMAKLPKDKQDATARAIALTAFNRIDLNKDGKADWKELAATLATFDQRFGSKDSKDLNGEISSEDYAKWSEALGDEKTNTFENAVKRNYKGLFDKSDK